jgi:beta-galactosidase
VIVKAKPGEKGRVTVRASAPGLTAAQAVISTNATVR